MNLNNETMLYENQVTLTSSSFTAFGTTFRFKVSTSDGYESATSGTNAFIGTDFVDSYII